MPILRCTEGGRPGWKFGESGACFTYTAGSEESSNRAKERAFRQAAAIVAAMERRGDRTGAARVRREIEASR